MEFREGRAEPMTTGLARVPAGGGIGSEGALTCASQVRADLLVSRWNCGVGCNIPSRCEPEGVVHPFLLFLFFILKTVFTFPELTGFLHFR